MPADKTTLVSADVSAAIIVAATLLPDLAIAYVGPGAAVSALGALWGLIVGIVVALAVILFWPIRILIRKMKQKNAATEQPSAEQANSDGRPSQPPTPD
jgi:membrane protein implicated in regulation of membrane protease activity